MKRATRLAGALALATMLASPVTLADEESFAARLLQGVISNIGQIAQKSDVLLGNVSAEDEANMGRAAAAVLLGVAPPLRDAQLQAYVNRVGKWLVMQTERPELDWRFAVLDDDTVNAFATPGGHVFVTRGLFMVLRNEAELAGILAHEIAHVLARHHVEALISKERGAVLLDVVKDASGIQGGISDALVAATKSIYASGLDQGDELEADLMGTVIAARAGYEPYGLQQVLLTLEGIAPSSNALAFFVSTHPPFRTRIDAIDDALSGELDTIGGETAEGSLAGIQARLRLRAAR
jgi:predicted Zn-dependent protease